ARDLHDEGGLPAAGSARQEDLGAARALHGPPPAIPAISLLADVVDPRISCRVTRARAERASGQVAGFIRGFWVLIRSFWPKEERRAPWQRGYRSRIPGFSKASRRRSRPASRPSRPRSASTRGRRFSPRATR